MATIQEKTRVDGGRAWAVQVRRKGFPPQRKTFTSKTDAEAWAKVMEADMIRGVSVDGREAENTTLAKALDRYEREVIPGKKGAVQESMRIRIWRRTELARRFLASIHGKDIAAYRDLRLKEVAPNTVRHELAILSHVFTIAVKEWGLTSLVNPVKQIRMPKMPRGRDRRLLPGELEAVIAVSRSPSIPDIASMAVETAMRQEEIVAMTWGNVDLKKKTVTLHDTKNGEQRYCPALSRGRPDLVRPPPPSRRAGVGRGRPASRRRGLAPGGCTREVRLR